MNAVGRWLHRAVIGVAVVASFVGRVVAAEPAASFKTAVAAVLVDNCLACHGPRKAEGGYRLDTFERLRVAGDSGEQPVVPGATPGGELLRRITSDDPDERMPPDAPPLPPAAVAAVRGWLAVGGSFDGGRPDEPLAFVMPPRMQPSPASYAAAVPVTALAFTPDGSRLIVGGYHELLVFDVADGKLLRRIPHLGQRVTAIRWLADGRRVAVAGGEPGRDGDVRLVDVEAGVVKAVLARSLDLVHDVAVRPGGSLLAAATSDGVIRLVDADSGVEQRAIPAFGDWATAVAWSDDGKRLASAGRDKSAKVYDSESGDLLGNFTGHNAAVRGIALTADGKQAMSTAADGRLFRWDVETSKPVGAAVPVGGEGLRLVRDGGLLVVAGADRNVRIIDAAKFAVVRSLAHPDWPLSAAVSGSSGRIATGAIDGIVRIWNLADGTLIREWPARP